MSLSQQDLAEKCSVSQPAISRIESGTKTPSTKAISMICKTLDIPESIIYIIAIQEEDVHKSKQHVYKMLYPTIKDLAAQIAVNKK